MPKVKPLSTRTAVAIVRPAKDLKKRIARPAKAVVRKIVKK